MMTEIVTEAQSLSALIAKRYHRAYTSEENNFDFDAILSGLNSDPLHFVFVPRLHHRS